jgi:TrmH family RNA methyltransferase
MDPSQPEIISSIKNPRIQLIRSLLVDKSTRREENLFITEGVRLAEEVLNAGIKPKSIFYSNQITERAKELIQLCLAAGVTGFEVTPDVMNRVSETETAQGLLMVVGQNALPLPASSDLVVVMDQIRDPGNCGTILRTAAAAGVKVVFFTPGSVDPFMPKVVRSGMGAHFRLGIRQADWTEIQNYCKPASSNPLQILLADSSAGKSLWQIDLGIPLALIIGGEAEGASLEAKQIADSLVNIPMPGGFESLNAGVAASILLFEIVRQRVP